MNHVSSPSNPIEWRLSRSIFIGREIVCKEGRSSLCIWRYERQCELPAPRQISGLGTVTAKTSTHAIDQITPASDALDDACLWHATTACWRRPAQIVPGPSSLTQPDDAQSGQRVHRVSWAKLLARVFQYDVMWPSCSGRMKILTSLIKPGSVGAYLDGVGLPSRAPPIAPSRLGRQLEFDEPA